MLESEIGFAIVELDAERFHVDVYGIGTIVAPSPIRLRDTVDYTR